MRNLPVARKRCKGKAEPTRENRNGILHEYFVRMTRAKQDLFIRSYGGR